MRGTICGQGFRRRDDQSSNILNYPRLVPVLYLSASFLEYIIMNALGVLGCRWKKDWDRNRLLAADTAECVMIGVLGVQL